MQFLETELRQVTEMVWDSILGVSLVTRPGGPTSPHRMVSAWVQFTGAWEGAVTVECSAAFARRAAASMFGVEPGATTPADARDAIGELTNMTGGNIKALLPGPCRLSLPSVVEGAAHGTSMPEGEIVTTVAFDCEGSPLVVRLLQNTGNGRT